MTVWQITFNAVILLLCIMYLVHCYVWTGDTLVSTLANRVRSLPKYSDSVATENTGTRHSFSYLISNARAITEGKRKQTLALFAQLARGIRNFHVDLFASRKHEDTFDGRVRVSIIGGAEIAVTIMTNSTYTNLYILDVLDEIYYILEESDERDAVTIWVEHVKLAPNVASTITTDDVLNSVRTYVLRAGYEKRVNVLSITDGADRISWVEFFR